MDAWTELVELFEYKVADIIAGRDPRGGRRSLGALRDTLLHGPLEAPLLRRFRQADKAWRDYVVAATRGPSLPGTDGPAETLGTWNMPSSSPVDDEGQILTELAGQLWRLRIEDQLSALVARWRKEGGLVTLRAMYALSLNLEAGRIEHDVPEANDPLVSLGNSEIALGILVGLVDQLVAYRSETLTPIAWARSMMMELANNPFPKARQAVLDAARDDVARGDGRQPGLNRLAERTQIREALGRGFESITQLLPPTMGGTGDELPSVHRALFARTPGRRMDAPDDGSSTLALRFTTPGQVQWQEQTIGWQPGTGGVTVTAGGATYQVPRDGETVGVRRVPLEGMELRLLAKNDYLLLDIESVERVSVQQLLARGRALAALLDANDDFAHLRLARGAAQWLRDGRFDPAVLTPESAAKYASATPDALFAFASKGMHNLLARIARRPASEVERAFMEVARTLGCPESRAMRVLDLLRNALDPRPLVEQEEIRSDNDVALVAYQGEPITLTVAGRVLTLRADYRGEVTGVLPGAPAMPIRDVWVFCFPQGGVIVARQGLRLAVGYQPTIAR